MILSYAKPFNEKMREKLAKLWEKEKNMRYDRKTKHDDMKTMIYFVGTKIFSNS